MFSSAHATTVVIDFEDQVAGTIIDDEYSQYFTVTTNSNGTNDAAVIFDTDNPTGNDHDLESPFSPYNGVGGNLIAGNALIISEDARGVSCNAVSCTPADDEGRGGVISFMFNEAVTFLGLDALDITDSRASFRVAFYSLDNLLLSSITAPSGVGDNEFISLVDNAITNVGRVDFLFGGSGAIDNIRFETPATAVSAPGTLALVMSSLVGYGAMRRRKKVA